MKIRNIISTIHVPYRKVMYAVAFCAVIGLYAADWLPFSWYFVKYISLILILAVMLYFSFWMYKAGYRKQSLLLTIAWLALFAISIVVLIWAQVSLAKLGVSIR